MKAKLIDLHSPDIDDLFNYVPEDPENFSFLLQAFVGIEGQEGEESFDIEVYTPKWLLSNHKKQDIIFAHYSIIVFAYEFSSIHGKIKSTIEGCTGSSWEEIAKKVGQIGRWEFENYTE